MKCVRVFIHSRVMSAVVCMAICTSCAVVYGGTIEIATIEDLQKIGNDPAFPLDGNYVITKDIDAIVTGTWDWGFVPIAQDTSALEFDFNGMPFTGTLNGQGHIISDLVIRPHMQDYVGLFGMISEGSEISDLGLVNCRVGGRSRVAALCGENRGTVTGCYATGTVAGEGGTVGGLVAYNRGTITGSHTAVNVYGRNLGMVGGLTGRNEGGTISDCYATGHVGAEGSNCGGLLGMNYEGLVMRCFASGSVAARESVAGFVGDNVDGKVIACYSTGSLDYHAQFSGGFSSGNSGIIEACYTLGNVPAFEVIEGGFVASNSGTVISSFWNKQVSEVDISDAGRALNTAEMKNVKTFQNAGWDEYGWVMMEGQYPRLAWEGTGAPAIPSEVLPYEGSGTRNDPYQVGTPEQFASLSQFSAILDQYVALTADIDCNGLQLAPIGELGPVSGGLDGRGHTLHNASIISPNSDHIGIFARLLAGAELRDMTLANADIQGRYYVGGLAGHNEGTITDCHVDGRIRGVGYVGGLAAYNGGVITLASSTGQCDADMYVGGLVATNAGSLSACFTRALLSSSYFLGGVASQNLFNALIEYCYAAGPFADADMFAGGLVGRNDGIVKSSVWNKEVSGQTESAGSDPSCGKTTLEMGEMGTYFDWDFEATWGLDAATNDGYPHFLPPQAPLEGEPQEGDIHEGEPTEGEVWEGQIPEGEVQEGASPEGMPAEGDVFPDGEAVEGGNPEGQSAEGMVVEGDIAEGQVPEGQPVEGEVAEGQSREGQIIEGESPEGRNPEGQPIEGEAREGQLTEGETVEGQPAEGSIPEGQSTDGESGDGQTTDGEPTEGDTEGDGLSPVSIGCTYNIG